MEVQPKGAAGTSRFGEWEDRFCSQRCKDDFDADRIKYLLKK